MSLAPCLFMGSDIMIVINAPFYIEVSEDTDYSLNSTDNVHNYDIILNPENCHWNDYHKSFSIIMDDKSALLICGYYSYPENVLFVDNLLVIMCENIIYKIDVDKMEVVFRKVMYDLSKTTFDIYKVSNGYIVYGEMEIAKLDNDFNVINIFMGRDIFVTIDGLNAFEMNENEIVVRDFLGNTYYLDYNCKLIKEVIK